MAEDSMKNSYCFYSVLLWSITNSDARYGKRSRSFQPPHTSTWACRICSVMIKWCRQIMCQTRMFPPSFLHRWVLTQRAGWPNAPTRSTCFTGGSFTMSSAGMFHEDVPHSMGKRNPQPVPAHGWIQSPRTVVCFLSPMHADETTWQVWDTCGFILSLPAGSE